MQSDFVTVGGVDFFFALHSNIFFDGEEGEEPRSPEDLREGQFVSVTGVWDASGTLVVDWLFVPNQPGNRARISGTSEATSTFGMTLWGQQIAFDEDTQFFNPEYEPVAAEDVVDDLEVVVFGTYIETDLILAEVVEIKGEDKEEIQLSGRVESFDGSQISIGGIVFNIESFTQFEGGEEQPEPGDGPPPPTSIGKYEGVSFDRFLKGRGGNTGLKRAEY